MRSSRIMSISGGKASTSLLILFSEKRIPLDHVVFIDTTVEFPQNVEFVKGPLNDFVEENFGISIEIIRPKHDFEYYVKKYGVPHLPRGIWCSRMLKRNPFREWLQREGIRKVVNFIGYTYDEIPRAKRATVEIYHYWKNRRIDYYPRYPLISFKVGDKRCFELCSKYNLLNPLYRYFDRIGCFVCPFQKKRDWITLREKFPELFFKALEYERMSKWPYRGSTSLLEFVASAKPKN